MQKVYSSLLAISLIFRHATSHILIRPSFIAAGFFFVALCACNSTESDSRSHADNSSLTDTTSVTMDSVESIESPKEITISDSLIVAAGKNDIVLVKTLIEKGADVNYRALLDRDYWHSALSEAARRDHVAVAKLLIEAGADPNLDLGANFTAFHYSAGWCSMDVRPCSDTLFNLLLANGGIVNTLSMSHTSSPLLAAIHSADLYKLDVLLKLGAAMDPDSINGFQSALGHAARESNYEIFQQLLRSGANINAIYSEATEDCIRCPFSITVVHELILMYGYSRVSLVDSMLDLILQYKPDLSIENLDALTPLAFAAFAGDTALVEKLMAHGAKLETPGESPLYCAANFSNYKMVEYLLRKGAKANVKGQSGDTPLVSCLTCCGGGFGDGITEDAVVKTIELLLDHGADPTVKNDEGKSFLDLSRESPHKDVIKFLVKRRLLKP